MSNPVSTLRVAALQCALTDEVTTNVDRIEALLRDAAHQGAQLALPSELFEGHYFCQEQKEENFLRARPAAGHPTIARMQKLAAELGMVIPVSFFEKDGPAYYNSAAVIDADGAVLGIYRKSHIPDGPGYQEKFYFRPGQTGFMSFATRVGTIGVGICWDQWFPEAARAMVLAGADILLYPTAIGSEPEEPEFDSKDSWQRAMIGHAVCNAVPVVASNRVGTEGAMTFYGSSFICNERGDKLAEMERGSEGVIVADLNLAEIARARASMGFFRDRRPSLYHSLIK